MYNVPFPRLGNVPFITFKILVFILQFCKKDLGNV